MKKATWTALPTADRSLVCSLDVSPDGSTLAVGRQGLASGDAALTLWSLADLSLLTTVLEGEGVPLARFSPGGGLLAYTDADQNLVLRDLRTGVDDRERFVAPYTKWIDFAHRRDRLLAGGPRTRLWDADAESVVWMLDEEPLPASAAIDPPRGALSAPGDRVALAAPGVAQIRIIDVEGDETIATLEWEFDAIRSMAFDPNGRFLGAVSTQARAAVWDLEAGKSALSAVAHPRADYYWCVRFHPDGEHVALGLWSGFIEIYSLRTGKRVLHQDTPAHQGRVWDLAITPEGGRMVTGGDDGAVLLWDLDLG